MFHRLMLIVALLMPSSAAHAATASLEQACANAHLLELDSTARGYARQGAMEVFMLDIPEAGVLALDVTLPGPAEADARLGMLGPDCSPPTDRDPLVIERSAAHQVVAIGPGTYFFRLAAQDPRATLGEYQLTVGFAADIDGIEPDVVDPKPGSHLTAPAPQIAATPHKVGPEIVNPDPDFAAPGGGLAGLCRQPLDDHADTFTCATALRLGHRLSAEVDGGREDEADMFTFTLDRVRTLRIASAGPTDTLGALYDHFGHRLAIDDDDGLDGSFRIVKTLAPGRYFVRVEGRDGAEGAYGLAVETLDW